MDKSVLASARVFMGGNEMLLGGEKCVSCGLERANEKISKAMNSTFNCFGLFLFQSMFICPCCMNLFKDSHGRTRFIFYTEPEKKVLVERENILDIISSPPRGKFVLSIPYSFQKHHWIHAGLSDEHCAYVGTDQGTVRVDYEAYDVPCIVSTIKDMVLYGVPRKEITLGKYSTFTLSNFGCQISAWEDTISSVRPCGAVDLIVRHVPAVKKQKHTFGGDAVFNDIEAIAIDILKSIASASKYRKENGLEFWGGFFKRRVTRHKEYDLHKFFSMTCRTLYCDPVHIDVNILESLDEDLKKSVMKEIQEKSDLLIAAAYTSMREDKESNAAKQKEKLKDMKNAQGSLLL